MSTKLSQAPVAGTRLATPKRRGRLVKKAGALRSAESRSRSALRSISLAEASRLAIGDLLEAEARRQEERNREAACWAAMDEEA